MWGGVQRAKQKRKRDIERERPGRLLMWFSLLVLLFPSAPLYPAERSLSAGLEDGCVPLSGFMVSVFAFCGGLFVAICSLFSLSSAVW